MDPSGPLANLRKLIFSPEGFQTMKEWLSNYWYVVLASGVGLVLFMVSTNSFGINMVELICIQGDNNKNMFQWPNVFIKHNIVDGNSFHFVSH